MLLLLFTHFSFSNLYIIYKELKIILFYMNHKQPGLSQKKLSTSKEDGGKPSSSAQLFWNVIFRFYQNSMLTIKMCLGIRAIIFHFTVEGAKVLRCHKFPTASQLVSAGLRWSPGLPATRLVPLSSCPGLPGITEVGSFLTIPSRTPAECALGAGDSESQTQSLSRTPWCDLEDLALKETLSIQCAKWCESFEHRQDTGTKPFEVHDI